MREFDREAAEHHMSERARHLPPRVTRRDAHASSRRGVARENFKNF